MRIAIDLILLIASLLVVALSLVLWDATGRAGYTKFFDPDRHEQTTEAEQSDSIADVFGEAGADVEPVERLKNRFEFGLAPSGPDKHIVSVATIGGPAGAAGLAALLMLGLDLRARKKKEKKAGA